MPLIISQTALADGIRIIMGASVQDLVQITSADLPAGIKSGTIAACETYVNGQLATRLAGRGFTTFVKVISIVPLVVQIASAPPGTASWPTRG